MHFSKLRILLVEDEFLIYRDLVKFFESNECVVVKHPAKKTVNNYDDAVSLLQAEQVDLAVLDIEIKGDKNGLVLCNYINEHFWIPVIIFSEKSSKENQLAAGLMNAGAFVVKRGKPPDFTQLQSDLNRLRPLAEKLCIKKTIGGFFDVAKFSLQQNSKEEYYVKKMIKWEEILFITTVNNIKNAVTICLENGTQWITRGTLQGIQPQLPPFITTFNRSEMVNIKKIERSSKTPFEYYINDQCFKISDTYAETALAVIRLFLNQAYI